MEGRGRKEGNERVRERKRKGDLDKDISYSPLRKGNIVVTHNGVVM